MRRSLASLTLSSRECLHSECTALLGRVHELMLPLANWIRIATVGFNAMNAGHESSEFRQSPKLRRTAVACALYACPAGFHCWSYCWVPVHTVDRYQDPNFQAFPSTFLKHVA